MNSLLIVQRRWPDTVCVTGQMTFKGVFECYTLEPPYAADTVKPRCIPAGTYPLTIRFSPRFNRLMPHIENVPGFEGVEIHWGNFPHDTEACTVVGSLIGTNFVGHSVAEFDTLFLKIQDVVSQGPQTITFLDAPVTDFTETA